MTLGAAALGIAATGIFAYAAAMTYTGKTSTVNADQQVTRSSNGGGNVDPNAGAQQQIQQQNGLNPFYGATPPQTTSRHHSFVTSGGS